MARPKSCLSIKLQPWQENVQARVRAKGKLCRSGSTLKAPLPPTPPVCTQSSSGLNLSDFVTEPLRLKAQSHLQFLRKRTRAFLKPRLKRGPALRGVKSEEALPDLALFSGTAQPRTVPVQLSRLRQRLSLGCTCNEERSEPQGPVLMVALGVRLRKKLCH